MSQFGKIGTIVYMDHSFCHFKKVFLGFSDNKFEWKVVFGYFCNCITK